MTHGGNYNPNLLRTPQERVTPKSEALLKIEARQAEEAAKRKRRKKKVYDVPSGNVIEINAKRKVTR